MVLFQDKIKTHLDVFSPLKKANRLEFVSKVYEISKTLKIQPNWLMAVMWHESRLDSRAVNNVSGAVGLIQFMPSILKSKWNLSPTQIRNITNIQQLHFVGEYYKNYAGKMSHALHLFLVTFYPLALSKRWDLNDDYVFGSEQSEARVRKIAEQNKGFDLNGDGRITMREYIDYHNDYFAEIGIKPYRYKPRKNNKTKIIVATSIIGISVIATGLYFYKNKNNVKSLSPHR